MKFAWTAKTNSMQEVEEEVEEGAIYCVTLKRVQIQQAANKGARWLGVEGDHLPPGHTVRQLDTCKIRSIRAGTLERLVETLLTAFEDNDLTYTSVFLYTYRTFTSTDMVLELLLARYGCMEEREREEPSCPEREEPGRSDSRTRVRNALASILRAWLDQCPEDFQEPPSYPSLRRVLDFLQRALPGSEPLRKAQILLEQLNQAHMESKQEGGIHGNNPFCLGEEEEVEIEQEDFLSFDVELVAEQLTCVDAELFRKVIPHQCLGSVWSQRDRKPTAPTIRATITQFNAVAACVVSTVLHRRQLRPHLRARIIQHWINIAKECRICKNFSSLKAIISALQSNPVYRLKKTWACVHKDSMQTFEELSEIFSDQNNYLTCRELLMREGTSKFASVSCAKEHHKRSHKRPQLLKDTGAMRGTVPYLGTFLTDLSMLDAALPDMVEGGLINFEKRRREFEVIAQIKLLQSACNTYCLTPDPVFLRWFNNQPQLSEEESYILSCEIEGVSSPPSPKACPSVVKRLSLLFLGADAVTVTSPVRDSASLPPVGSVGESVDSVNVSSKESLPLDREGLTSVHVPEGTQKKTAQLSDSCCSFMDSPSSPTCVPLIPASLPSDYCPSPCLSPATPTSPCIPPTYDTQARDACIIRIRLEHSNGNLYKSILVTSQDKTPAVISRAIAKHRLQGEAVDRYELVQVISEERELVVPDNANVFYAMNTSAKFDFLLRLRTSPGRPVHLRSCGSSTLHCPL